MLALTEKFTGIIIGLSPRAERYVRWELLSAMEGFCAITASQKQAMPFGIFDTVEVIAKQRNKILFLQEAGLISRPDGLSKNIPAFQEAAKLTRLTRSGFQHLPDYQAIYHIFEKALLHLQKTRHPLLITLKALYKMLLQEGFPVAEDWLSKLHLKQRENANLLLKIPIDKELPPNNELIHVLRSLLRWSGTELGFDPSPYF